MTVITIARLTIAEAVRRRIVLVLIALTLVSVALTTLGVERLVSLARADGTNDLQIQVGISQILILVAFMFSFVLAMTAAFLGAPAIAADLESGVAAAILVRPIRRAELVLGRWLGLVVVVVAYAVASGLLEIAGVGLVSGSAPPYPMLAVGYLAAQAIVLLTLAILLSTRVPAIASGAICVVLFGLAWMAGVFAGIGTFLQAGPPGSSSCVDGSAGRRRAPRCRLSAPHRSRRENDQTARPRTSATQIADHATNGKGGGSAAKNGFALAAGPTLPPTMAPMIGGSNP